VDDVVERLTESIPLAADVRETTVQPDDLQRWLEVRDQVPWKAARSDGRAAHNQPPARDGAVDYIGVFDAAIDPARTRPARTRPARRARAHESRRSAAHAAALRDPPSLAATRPRYSDAAVSGSPGIRQGRAGALRHRPRHPGPVRRLPGPERIRPRPYAQCFGAGRTRSISTCASSTPSTTAMPGQPSWRRCSSSSARESCWKARGHCAG
jgi:hypothetical protein